MAGEVNPRGRDVEALRAERAAVEPTGDTERLAEIDAEIALAEGKPQRGTKGGKR
jgi:hypothetical protein